jgi:glycosyltransferase involved in cell wall biosynthesis
MRLVKKGSSLSNRFDKINFIVPTRGRANTRLPKFIESMLDTADDIDRIHFTFVVDNSDEETKDYLSQYSRGFSTIINHDDDKPHLASLMNQGFDETPFKGADFVYGYIGDDFISLTEGWDTLVLEICNNSHGMRCVWGYDNYLNDLPTYYFMADTLFRALGTEYWVYPKAAREVTDLVTRDMLAPMGLLFHCDELTFDHRHATRFGYDATFSRLQTANISEATTQDVCDYILKCQRSIKTFIKEKKYRDQRTDPVNPDLHNGVKEGSTDSASVVHQSSQDQRCGGVDGCGGGVSGSKEKPSDEGGQG